MKPTKLPSGSWRVRVTRNKVTRSFTAPTRAEAQKLAAAFVATEEYTEREGISVQQAMLNYVEAKRNVISPSTIQLYEHFCESAFLSLRTMPVNRLTSLDIQSAVNEETARKTQRGTPVSAKTVKNAYEFLRAAVSLARPEFAMRVTLPRPVKTFRDLPRPEEVISAVRGTDIELPAMLAMWLSLSISEIRGIKVSSIRDGILTIDESIVQVNGIPVHKKAAKAFDRNRRIRVPLYIMNLIQNTDAWKHGEGYIEPRSCSALSSRFKRVISGRMRFHDLRHLFASVGLALNIPEKYLMEQGGWSSTTTMKNVYQHTFERERLDHQDQIDQYWENLLK